MTKNFAAIDNFCLRVHSLCTLLIIYNSTRACSFVLPVDINSFFLTCYTCSKSSIKRRLCGGVI